MPAKHFVLCLFIALLACAISALNVTPGQLLFKTSQSRSIDAGKIGITAFDTYLSGLGASNLRRVQGMPGSQYYLVDLEREPDWEALQAGRYAFEGIEYIQPNYLRQFHIEPNDPLYSRLQHPIVSLPQAWNLTTGSDVVIVGIIDSGVLMEHPDLAANIFINESEIPDNGLDDDNNGYIDDWRGWDFCDAPELTASALGDFLTPDNDASDENYHGTHVAGIVGAVGNNGVGVCGVAWNVRLLPIRAGFRVTGGEGYLQDDDAAAAIIYAADMGASVVNMSWGDPSYSPIIADACEYAYNRGTTLVASSGNTFGPNLSYPAKLSTVISVASVSRARVLSSFSSYGVDLDVVAPGELVLSTYKTTPGEQYLEQSGTSMSSPYVTGAIALLKSVRPDLSPEEVRSRVLNSTDDLGDPGFDIRYGHGLLNVRKLLENINPPVINLTYPLEMQGVSSPFQIEGTVQAENFLRYSVMRSSKSAPSESDWRNVHDDTGQPFYYYSQVSDGVVAQFNIPDHLPEGRYLIRIQFRDQQGASYNYYRTVIYDSTSPLPVAGTLQSFERYEAQNLRHYISAKFNEPVRSSLIITASDGSLHYSYSAVQDSIQIWALPSSIPPGMISVRIQASNQSGMGYSGPQIADFKDIQYQAVKTYGYERTDIGAGRVPLTGSFDFNANNYQEYISMDLPSTGYGRVKAYEPRTAGHLMVYDFGDSFQPLALGSTDNESLELLCHKSDRVFLRKQMGNQIYPSTIAWQDSSISGGTMGNFTAGSTGILLVKNLTTENVIQTYRRDTDTTFVATNKLRNTTPTSLRNTFAPTIIVDNLDRDALPDILCADTDGDVMIYEVINANAEQLCWNYRMPVANTYQLSSGDYTGDGNREFIVGGNYTSILNPDMNFWYFESFRSTGNNLYESMGSIMFNNVQSQNAIHSVDLDEDGKDEVILALSPNLYIMKYTEGQWKPEFYGESFQTFKIGTYTDTQNKLRFLTNYRAAADTTRAAEWTRGTVFTGPVCPYLSTVEPNDHESVRISWLDSGAPAYNVYMMYPDGSTELVASTDANSYLIQGLTESLTYGFTVTAVDDSYSPSESMPSPWRMATPYRRPTLMGINMVGNNEIRILFDQAMANDAVNPSYYSVDNGIGMPTSVNQILNQHGMQLRFSTNLSPESSPYTLSFHNVRGKTGTLPEQTEFTFEYIPDTEAPRVLSATASHDRKSFTVLFSEPLDPTGVNDLENYSLTVPTTDSTNRIFSAILNDNSLTINLQQAMRYSNQSYYIEICGLKDLSGNALSPRYNTARVALEEIRNLSRIKLFPNPIYDLQQNWLTFVNFPDGHRGRISIFDSAGSLVYSSSIGPFNSESNNITWRWNLINNSGLKVSSGIYYYVIEMNGDSRRGQFAIIK